MTITHRPYGYVPVNNLVHVPNQDDIPTPRAESTPLSPQVIAPTQATIHSADFHPVVRYEDRVILDSGASSHCTPHRDLLSNLESYAT